MSTIINKLMIGFGTYFSTVHEHYMIVIKDLKELEKLRLDMQRELQIDLILQSLTSLYSQFIINFI